ncbi:MAG: hypothetical protein R3296_05915 [Oleiphilaceae bacterium]|nr:hypothetical protein [Oleiphilaceae bacterium]
MGIWEILGIAPTRDRAAIKQAYEQQKKFSDPDNDRETWQSLQEAYREAMLYAGDSESMRFSEPASPATAKQAPVSAEAEMAAGRVMAELETVYSNPAWRHDLQRWRAQLESERAHGEGVTEQLRFQVFDFLSRQPDQEESLPDSRVLDYLDQRLGWNGHRQALEARFGERRVSRILGSGQPTGPEDALANGENQELEGQVPQGLGIALIGWVVALMILTVVFGELMGG